MIPQIAFLIGGLFGLILLHLSPQWLTIAKLSDVLAVILAVSVAYGLGAIFQDLTTWWLK